jgi:hypothetical protein
MLIICHCAFQLGDVAHAEISVPGGELSEYDHTGCDRQRYISVAEIEQYSLEQYSLEQVNSMELTLVWQKDSPDLHRLFAKHSSIFSRTTWQLRPKLEKIIGN